VEIEDMPPKVLNVAPKDIHVTLEFPIQELEQLRTGIALANISYNGRDKKEAEAVAQVHSFWRFLDEFLSEVNRNGS
jgi:hypothetical protein